MGSRKICRPTVIGLFSVPSYSWQPRGKICVLCDIGPEPLSQAAVKHAIVWKPRDVTATTACLRIRPHQEPFPKHSSATPIWDFFSHLFLSISLHCKVRGVLNSYFSQPGGYVTCEELGRKTLKMSWFSPNVGIFRGILLVPHTIGMDLNIVMKEWLEIFVRWFFKDEVEEMPRNASCVKQYMSNQFFCSIWPSMHSF